MYFISLLLLLLVIPATSVAIEAMHVGAGADIMGLVGKWFVFWACGVRLFVAGIMQTMHPEFTAKSIFEIDAPAAHAIVREVGFGNLAMGTLGLAISWPAVLGCPGGNRRRPLLWARRIGARLPARKPERAGRSVVGSGHLSSARGIRCQPPNLIFNCSRPCFRRIAILSDGAKQKGFSTCECD